jgi:protocatechuate 3,4-dioxygenase beta subunit
MQRRSFLKNTAFGAVAVSTSGFIRFNGEQYIGDCETTTDILGPFYRPGSPIRNNLVITGDRGTRIQLSGIIRHNDCKTPYPKAKIELWHCSPSGEYDNSSNDFLYRGTNFSDDKGRYSFDTILPVPYGIGNGITRPAHFHLMITAQGYQPFVTQLYFAGDENIAKDPSASSLNAKRRILAVQSLKDGTKKVSYDISMSPKLAADSAVIDRLTGVYTDQKDNTKIEFFKKNKSLWMKNEVFGIDLEYTGNNIFHYPGLQRGHKWTFMFELMPQGSIKVTNTLVSANGEIKTSVAVKDM